jgi:hypothetical protein
MIGGRLCDYGAISSPGDARTYASAPVPDLSSDKSLAWLVPF